jgi:D-hexose-6-phosphate mutarotase
VAWNPGLENARHTVEVSNAGWLNFISIGAENAGPDVFHLQAGENQALTQHLRVTIIF